MKIMIIGGTGLLGYNTALAALAGGHRVCALATGDRGLKDWYPAEIHVELGDVFNIDEGTLTELLTGFDALVYSVGPDDRVTPPAPAWDFFHDKLVKKPEAVFRAARRAGVRRAVVYNSYFAYFDRIYPEMRLAALHPYIRARIAQAERLIAEGGREMDVMVLELPYIFGAVPGRPPLWKDVFIERFFRWPAVFFPKGGTTMMSAEHVGQAGVGALEYGVPGRRYPLGDENHNYRYMLEAMEQGLGMNKPIIQVGPGLCALGARFMTKRDAKNGLQSGLNMEQLMRGVMSRELFIPESLMDSVCAELHVGRGGLRESILQTVKAAYPNGFGKR